MQTNTFRIAILLTIVCLLFSSCTTNTRVSSPTPNPNMQPGELTISDITKESEEIFYHGDTNVPAIKFNVEASDIEDIELKRMTIDLYKFGYDLTKIKNFTLSDEQGNVFGRTNSLIKSHKHSAQFNGSTIIKKAETKTFTMTVDVPQDSENIDITFIVDKYEEFIGKGLSSYRNVPVAGDAWGKLYAKSVNNKGAIVISDNTDKPVFPRIAKGSVLSKFNIRASSEEDVMIKKIGLRITNLIPGQYKNVSLLREDGSQFGSTVINPRVVDAEFPNIIYTDTDLIRANETKRYSLVADTNIPASQSSEYGTQLQREIVMFGIDEENNPSWINATGATTGDTVDIFGRVSTFLSFLD